MQELAYASKEYQAQQKVNIYYQFCAAPVAPRLWLAYFCIFLPTLLSPPDAPVLGNAYSYRS